MIVGDGGQFHNCNSQPGRKLRGGRIEGAACLDASRWEGGCIVFGCRHITNTNTEHRQTHDTDAQRQTPNLSGRVVKSNKEVP